MRHCSVGAFLRTGQVAPQQRGVCQVQIEAPERRTPTSGRVIGIPRHCEGDAGGGTAVSLRISESKFCAGYGHGGCFLAQTRSSEDGSKIGFGCDVEQVRIPLLGQNNYFDPAITLYGAELGRYVRRFVGDREAELHYIGKIYVPSPDPSLGEYIDAEIKVDKLKGAFAGYFQHYDVLLCPVIPFTAPLPGLESYVINGEKVPSTHMMRATVPFNLTGLPALSVPFTFSSEQLPINVQLVSRWLDEATILRLGSLVEAGNKAQHRHPNL